MDEPHIGYYTGSVIGEVRGWEREERGREIVCVFVFVRVCVCVLYPFI